MVGDVALLRSFQATLAASGVPLAWFVDVGVDHPAFASLQTAAVAGELDVDPNDLHACRSPRPIGGGMASARTARWPTRSEHRSESITRARAWPDLLHDGYPQAILSYVAKVLISIPGDLLARVDREAASRGDTRSDFFQDAARRALGWPSKETVAAALERGRAALATEGPFESADLIAADRAGRDATDRRRR